MSLRRRSAEKSVGIHTRRLLENEKFRDAQGYPRHLSNWTSNLLAGIDPSMIKSDLDGGAGGELREGKNGRPEGFSALHSSTALCVNSFGLFRQRPEDLILFDWAKFSDVKFEAKCSTGISRPNLDLIAKSSDRVIGVESKFLETLDDKSPKFSPRYLQAFEDVGDRILSETYQHVEAEPEQWKRLDAAQLLKHSLGLLNTFGEHRLVSLVYVYWEPLDFEAITEYQVHRSELSAFADLLKNSAIDFRYLSYQELWSGWEGKFEPPLSAHIKRLRERYDISLQPH